MTIPNKTFNEQKGYCATITIAKRLFKEGVITPVEYKNINNSFIKSIIPSSIRQGTNPSLSN